MNSSYATLIENIDTLDKRQNIYSQFIQYFGNLPFYKIEDKGSFSIYMCRITCQLCVLKRYLIVFVPRDSNPEHFKTDLSELSWICFQTQLTNVTHKIPEYNYTKKKDIPFFNQEINVVQRNPEKVVYSCANAPLKVELLPKNPRQKEYNKYEYADKGTLRHAIETFKTIITIVQ